jgi:single-strand DNA-binding protein
MSKKAVPEGDIASGRNEVVLVGRFSGEVAERELPSGDVLTSWRIVVDRAPDGQPAPAGRRLPTVDTIECATQRNQIRRMSASWTAGDVLEVTGALRRRFWRGPHGLASRYEVEAASVRRLSRAAAPALSTRVPAAAEEPDD